MAWTFEEIDRLIDHVSEYPFLYDHSNPDYYNKDVVYQMWTQIGQMIGIKGSHARTMWNQIVKIYTWLENNEIHKLDEGCYWPYLGKMKFLKPFLGNYRATMNLSLGEELIDYEASLETGMPVPAFITFKILGPEANGSENLGSMAIQDGKVSFRPHSPCDPEDKSFLPHSPISASLNGLSFQKNLEVEEAMCQYLRKKIAKVKDPNELFLSSVAHDMKMLSWQDQAVFKMKVQQLLVEMLSKSNGEVNISDG